MPSQCQQCGAPINEGAKFCPQCGVSVSVAETESVSNTQTPVSKKKWVIAGILAVVLVGGLSAYFKVLLRQFHPVIENQPSVVVSIDYGAAQKIPSKLIEVQINQGSIVVPLNAVLENKLVRFFDPEHIQSVPMIAYVTPEGKIVTAMSISENCRSTDFYLEGHDIHCAACPSYWNMSSMEAYACCQKFYPDPISSSVANNEIKIDAKLVRGWKSRI
ncbi:MAG: DUF2318 domain-containing protein [Ignavibacteriales bacterium]|nr:DUF2318 domain-containing protein [Ignavibacteriales bacterium]